MSSLSGTLEKRSRRSAVAARRRRRAVALSLVSFLLLEPVGLTSLAEGVLLGRADLAPGLAVARPHTRVAIHRRGPHGGSADWVGPVRTAGYQFERLEEVTPATLANVDVFVLDLEEGTVLRHEELLAVRARLQAGMRAIVHDTDRAHQSILAGVDEPALAFGLEELRHGTSIAPDAARTLVRFGPGGRLDELPADMLPLAVGGIPESLMPAAASHLLVASDSKRSVLAFCVPRGAGALVYSFFRPHMFLGRGNDSQAQQILRDIYAPNLVAYAAWGGCNRKIRAIPTAIDILPGDDENRLVRRGIAVAILSSPLLDAPRDVDQTSLRFGKSGTEESLHRCSQRRADVNADGYPDLVCYFLHNRTVIDRSTTEAVLRARTTDGTPFESRDRIVY